MRRANTSVAAYLDDGVHDAGLQDPEIRVAKNCSFVLGMDETRRCSFEKAVSGVDDA